MKSDLVRRGETAPGFDLPASDGARRQLADWRGQNVVLVFYRGHW